MNRFQECYNALNPEQKKAVDKTEGPLLVLAGPGTGKTQLLSIRAANIIEQQKAEPENILILTFTNAGSRAMRERLAGIIGHNGYNVEVETFHSFANSIVLESENAVKYVKNKIDIADVEKIKAFQHILDTENSIKDLRPFGAPYTHLNEISSRISELKNEGITPEEMRLFVEGLEPDGILLEEKHISRLKELAIIYGRYERLKNEECSALFDERGRKDYDDMILIALEALTDDDTLREAMLSRYKYIMVDEYQDTNGAQLKLLFTLLKEKEPNICCVGDDDQAIYRFQGATLANFRILEERFPSLETVVLKNNYRSSQELIDLSGQIISQLPGDERIRIKDLKAVNKDMKGDIKFFEFMTEEEELAYLIKEIKKQAELIKKDPGLSEEEREKPYNNIAILVRKRAQRQKIIEALLKEGLPYASDGNENIRQEKRVQQMLDVLELANLDLEENEKRSLVLYKILSSDYAGASHTDILKLIGYAKEKRDMYRKNSDPVSFNLFQEFLSAFPADEHKAPRQEESDALDITVKLDLKRPNALHRTAWAVNRLMKDARTRPVHDILMGYIDDSGLYKFILEHYDENKVIKIRDLRSLVSFINMVKEANLSKPSLRLDDFLNELEVREVHSLPVNGELATLSQDGIRVYTAHSSKGLEFHTVFMPFCLEKKSWPVRRKGDVIPLPPEIYKSEEKIDEKNKLQMLHFYDELRLFYVAATRAKKNLFYTATPREKVIISRFFSHVDIDPRPGEVRGEEHFLEEYLKGDITRDPFSDIPSILSDIVRKLVLTPTKINTYISCPRKFLFNYVLGLPGKKTQHLVFGNCAHKALEDVYQHYMEKRDFPPFEFFKRSFNAELEVQGANDAIKHMCASRLESLIRWYKEESKKPVMPECLEKGFSVSFPEGFIFRGKIDKIEESSNSLIRVVDYKTGKPYKHVKAIENSRDLMDHECDDYYRQLIAYKMIFDHGNKENKTVSTGKLQFLEPSERTVKKYDLEKGEYRDIEIDITEKMVKSLEAVIVKCWKDMQDLKFDKLPERDDKKRCVLCDYDSICWKKE